jgi:hypothetical protein
MAARLQLAAALAGGARRLSCVIRVTRAGATARGYCLPRFNIFLGCTRPGVAFGVAPPSPGAPFLQRPPFCTGSRPSSFLLRNLHKVASGCLSDIKIADRRFQHDGVPPIIACYWKRV